MSAALPSPDRKVVDLAAAQEIRDKTNGTDGLPVIPTKGRALRHKEEDALSALAAANDPPSIFQRGGRLVRVREDEKKNPVIDYLEEAELRHALSHAANFVVSDADQHIDPPRTVLQNILSRGEWPFPSLVAITQAPSLSPDGTIADEPGYDPELGLYYSPPPGFVLDDVPDEPMPEDAQAAAEFVRQEVLGDFPFADEASAAYAMALLLTPVVRQAIEGQVPMYLINAPKAGTGKGLLADVAQIIATGQSNEPRDPATREEEWQKSIFAALRGGATFMFFDEVGFVAHGALKSATLGSALTRPMASGRILGRSEEARVENRATWVAAGNGIQLGGDLPRRCLWINLDPKTSMPWLRSGFRHDNLPQWVSAHRGRLLAALLTMARAWFVAGQPRPTSAAIGSFEAFSDMVGGILELAGVTGFLADVTKMYETADQAGAEWELFLLECEERFAGDTQVKDVTVALEEDDGLRDLLPSDLSQAADKGFASRGFKTSLGNAFKAHAGEMFGATEARIDLADTDNSGRRVYRFRSNRPATAGQERSA